MAEYPYKVISSSLTREEHDSKKAWLGTQGLPFGSYDLQTAPQNEERRLSYNFYWCFKDPETATAFRLRWLKNE
jgi:hypothetical protein